MIAHSLNFKVQWVEKINKKVIRTSVNEFPCYEVPGSSQILVKSLETYLGAFICYCVDIRSNKPLHGIS